MFLTGFIGFVFGMIAGAVLNRFLLRNVPVAAWKQSHIRLRYGALNWAIGIGGIFVAQYLVKWAAA